MVSVLEIYFFSILLLTLSSFPLHLGQIVSLLKMNNLCRHARVWQRLSQGLGRNFPINTSAEIFWEMQSSPFAAQARSVPRGVLERFGKKLWLSFREILLCSLFGIEDLHLLRTEL